MREMRIEIKWNGEPLGVEGIYHAGYPAPPQ